MSKKKQEQPTEAVESKSLTAEAIGRWFDGARTYITDQLKARKVDDGGPDTVARVMEKANPMLATMGPLLSRTTAGVLADGIVAPFEVLVSDHPSEKVSKGFTAPDNFTRIIINFRVKAADVGKMLYCAIVQAACYDLARAAAVGDDAKPRKVSNKHWNEVSKILGIERTVVKDAAERVISENWSLGEAATKTVEDAVAFAGPFPTDALSFFAKPGNASTMTTVNLKLGNENKPYAVNKTGGKVPDLYAFAVACIESDILSSIVYHPVKDAKEGPDMHQSKALELAKLPGMAGWIFTANPDPDKEPVPVPVLASEQDEEAA